MSRSNLSFRWAQMSDESWCRKCDPSVPVASLIRKIEHDEILLAQWDDRLAGYLRLEFMWQKLPFVGLIEVSETFRRQGVGAALLAFLERFLKLRGYDRLLSSSVPENQAGKSWHLKQGFTKCGELRGINPDNRDEVFFLKILTR